MLYLKRIDSMPLGAPLRLRHPPHIPNNVKLERVGLAASFGRLVFCLLPYLTVQRAGEG